MHQTTAAPHPEKNRLNRLNLMKCLSRASQLAKTSSVRLQPNSRADKERNWKSLGTVLGLGGFEFEDSGFLCEGLLSPLEPE